MINQHKIGCGNLGLIVPGQTCECAQKMRTIAESELRARIERLRKPECTCKYVCDCPNDAFNEALDAILATLSDPTPPTNS